MKRLAYLSGAPRVTTHDRSEAGGPRAHVLGVIEAFERLGWDVDRYIAGDQRWARSFAANGRESAARGASWRAAAADAVRAGSAAYNRRAVRRLGSGYDIAYERFGSFQSLGREFQRKGVPWILETSGPFFHEARVERGTLVFGAAARKVEIGAYIGCDLLVCVSEALRDWLAHHGVDPCHCVVIPNGVDVDRFDPDTVGQRKERDELVLGFVGTVLPWQGLDTLIDALAVVRGRGVDVLMEIVGDGPAVEDLRTRAVDAGVADAVNFAGQVAASEVPARVASFDLGVSGHVPLLDGLMYHSPLKLYEYLAMGVALLAADHAEARRLVQESGVGYLFPAGDVEALAAAIEDAASERRALRMARSDVRRYAVEAHSWDRRVRDLLGEIERRGL